MACTVTSLDKPIYDDAALGDLLPDEDADPLEELAIRMRTDALAQAVDSLPDIEAQVVRMRFGLQREEEPCTLVEIERRLDLPRGRIRRLEAQALDRLARMREIEDLR